jgi:hypothetical protein
MPPIDFCNCMNARARPSTVQTPPHLSTRWVGLPLRVTPNRAFAAQGSRPPLRGSCNPLDDVRSTPSRIYPDLTRARTPPVAPQHPPLPGLGLWPATQRIHGVRRRRAESLPAARTNPRRLDGRTGLPGPQRRSAARLEGPSPADTRESLDSRPHPRCLLPLGPTTPFESRRWAPRFGLGLPSPSEPSRHLCYRTRRRP